MLTLRLTQKLAAALRVSLPKEVVPAVHPCADWCGQKFTAGRSRYLLVTNTSTFYSVVLRAHGTATEADFIAAVVAGLRTHLFGVGHEFVFSQLIAPASAEVRFSPVADRRLLGVMNEFIFMARVYLTDLSPAETSDRLNDCPVSTLAGKFPRDAFPPGLVGLARAPKPAPGSLPTGDLTDFRRN